MTRLGDPNHVYIIAEAGSNWRMGTPERDMTMAKTLIDVAVDAGADAVKFQTYRAETVYVEQLARWAIYRSRAFCRPFKRFFAIFPWHTR